jgi:hypothetical protein
MRKFSVGSSGPIAARPESVWGNATFPRDKNRANTTGVDAFEMLTRCGVAFFGPASSCLVSLALRIANARRRAMDKDKENATQYLHSRRGLSTDPKIEQRISNHWKTPLGSSHS